MSTTIKHNHYTKKNRIVKEKKDSLSENETRIESDDFISRPTITFGKISNKQSNSKSDAEKSNQKDVKKKIATSATDTNQEITNQDEQSIGHDIKTTKPTKKSDSKNAHYCYILRNHHPPDANRTYNGYTVNPKRRIRQHNQEIMKGAEYTKKWGNKTWEIYALLKGFPDHHNATQCEWKIKHPAPKRIRPPKYNSPAGRIMGLNEVLQTERWTGNTTIDNSELSLKLWILDEYADLLSDVPDNIEVIKVTSIDLDDVMRT